MDTSKLFKDFKWADLIKIGDELIQIGDELIQVEF